MGKIMGKNDKKNMLLPILIAVFGGGLPILFGGDVRLFLFIIMLFFGLGVILLLVKLGVARDAILFTLGASLIINPNKFFMTEGLAMTHFGGLPVPFVSLTDLAMTALLWSELSRTADHPTRRLPKLVVVALFVWIVSMATSLIEAAHPGMGFWHMTFEWKCILLFLTIPILGRGRSAELVTRDLRVLFQGLAAGLFCETLAVLAEYAGAIGSGFSFFGIQIGGFKEALGNITANRVGGTYRHPNYLAIPMASMLVPMTAMALRSAGLPRLLFGGASACAIVNLLLTLSRGGWLAAAVSGLLFLAVLLSTREGLAFLKRNSRLILAICFFAVVAFGALSDTIMSKLFESSDTNISGRMVLNEMGLEMIRDHPLTGVGLNNSVDASDDYNLMEQFMAHSGIPPVIHNIYLLIGAEVGVVGLLAFVTLTLYLLIRGLALARKHLDGNEPAFLLAALAAGGFAYLTADMFGPGLRKLEIAYIFWAHLGMVTLLTNTVAPLDDGQTDEKNDVP